MIKLKVVFRHYFIGLIVSIVVLNILLLITSSIDGNYVIFNDYGMILILGIAFWFINIYFDIITYILRKENSQIYKLLRELSELDGTE